MDSGTGILLELLMAQHCTLADGGGLQSTPAEQWFGVGPSSHIITSRVHSVTNLFFCNTRSHSL